MSTKTDSNFKIHGPLLLYILNNLSEKSEFHGDLFELFGAEDGSTRGIVRAWDEDRKNFRTACWDWGPSNFRHVINLLYIIHKKSQDQIYQQEDFENFYKNKIQYSDDIVAVLRKEGLLKNKLLALYVLGYGKQFPVLVLEIEKVKWERGRKRPLLFEFRPIKYMICDPSTWDFIKKKCRDATFWENLLKSRRDLSIQAILKKYSGMAQAIYGLLPLQEFMRDLLKAKSLFIKDVEKFTGDEIVSDNQMFWEFFRVFTGRGQEKGEITLTNDYWYRIYNIPINSLTKKSLVFLQERGVANVLCHLLLEIFEDEYLHKEFFMGNEITYDKTRILRRNFPVGNIEGEKHTAYSSCNYDYCLNLEELGHKKKILFNLTTALWKKGHAEYNEFIQKWRYLHFTIPTNHPECNFVWYITIPQTEEDFFQGNKTHRNFEELIGEVGKGISSRLKSAGEGVLKTNDSRIYVMALFEKSRRTRQVKTELLQLNREYKKSEFYQTMKAYSTNF